MLYLKFGDTQEIWHYLTALNLEVVLLLKNDSTIICVDTANTINIQINIVLYVENMLNY